MISRDPAAVTAMVAHGTGSLCSPLAPELPFGVVLSLYTQRHEKWGAAVTQRVPNPCCRNPSHVLVTLVPLSSRNSSGSPGSLEAEQHRDTQPGDTQQVWALLAQGPSQDTLSFCPWWLCCCWNPSEPSEPAQPFSKSSSTGRAMAQLSTISHPWHGWAIPNETLLFSP